MQLVELQKHLIMTNCLRRSSMDNRNIKEEDNMAYDRDATLSNKQQTNKVDEQSQPVATEEKKVEQTQPQMPKQLEYANQVINSMTDDKGYNPIQTIIKTAPKTHGEAQFRKAQIDRGGYTPPTPMQMSGLTEEQVKANEEAQKQAKADAEAREQEEREAKHRKAEKLWSAIGDGISAIANMATVGAGADSMYNPADSLHSKVKSKWDEIKANKQAIAAAENKARMDLLLKGIELDARTKESEATRNFNVWKTETEEAGRNQRAKDKQEFDQKIADQRNETTLKAATIRGRSGGGGGSSGKPYGTFMGRPIMNQKDWEYEIYTSATEDEITKATERTGLTSKRINYTKLRSLVENRLNKK